jgi:hypothetical protein
MNKKQKIVLIIGAIMSFAVLLTAIMSFAQNLWWQSEYAALVKVVSSAKNSSLSTSYRTGPGGRGRVKLLLRKETRDGLILKVELPNEAISSIDPKTGQKIPSKTVHVITIRDHNLDGIPDDFKMEPTGEPLFEEKLTKDGFIKFRNAPEHQVILIQWSVGIGFSINNFLRGNDSATPR